jgi:hypothetical protein
LFLNAGVSKKEERCLDLWEENEDALALLFWTDES